MWKAHEADERSGADMSSSLSWLRSVLQYCVFMMKALRRQNGPLSGRLEF